MNDLTNTEGGTETNATLSQQTSEAAKTAFLDGLNEKHRAVATEKGYSSIDDIFAAAQKADGALYLPDFKDEKATAEFYDKLGRPKTPEEYKFQLPEGDKGEFAKQVAPLLHKAGLTNQQVEMLSGGWNELMAGSVASAKQAQEEATAKAEEAYNAEQTKQMKDLEEGEWKGNYDKNVELSRQAAKQYDVSPKMLGQLERVWGSKAVMKFFHKIGETIGDDGIHGGAAANNGAINMANPAEAAAKLARLKADPAWRAKFAANDPKAVEEFHALHKAITGGK